jgi:hypothetical protein
VGCCGSKRAAARAVALRRGNGSAAPRRAVSWAAPVAAARGADIFVRYLGVRPVRVRGAASGRTYHTSAADPMLAIDARDAAALIRTGLFRTPASAVNHHLD